MPLQSQAAQSHPRFPEVLGSQQSTARGPQAERQGWMSPSLLACAVLTQPTLGPPWRPRSTPSNIRAGFRRCDLYTCARLTALLLPSQNASRTHIVILHRATATGHPVVTDTFQVLASSSLPRGGSQGSER